MSIAVGRIRYKHMMYLTSNYGLDPLVSCTLHIGSRQPWQCHWETTFLHILFNEVQKWVWIMKTVIKPTTIQQGDYEVVCCHRIEKDLSVISEVYHLCTCIKDNIYHWSIGLCIVCTSSQRLSAPWRFVITLLKGPWRPPSPLRSVIPASLQLSIEGRMGGGLISYPTPAASHSVHMLMSMYTNRIGCNFAPRVENNVWKTSHIRIVKQKLRAELLLNIEQCRPLQVTFYTTVLESDLNEYV